ncbi:NAD(P)-dependent oxidoreductase, partial [bacterium]
FLEELLPNNVEGVYNVLNAAHLEGVRRVVFTSTVQTVWHHLDQREEAVETDVYKPCSLYGVTKIFGEMTGKWFHSHRGLEFIAIRLGWFERIELLEEGSWINNVWISPGDALRLFQCAIEAPGIGFAVVNGTSKPLKEFLSLKSAYELLGYVPQDDVAQIFPRVAELYSAV